MDKPSSSLSLAPAALALLVSLACAGCGGADFGENVTTGSSALGIVPMAECAIPDVNNIPGHESDFYLCAEELADFGQGCGDDGYLLGYGTKYAQRFYRQARPHMSMRGQRWIDDVLVCLQDDLRETIDETTSCDDIWSIAFDSHPACYLQNGFCTLSPFDIAHVVWTIDAKDWLSRDAARQVVATAVGCGRQYEVWMRFLFGHLVDG